MPHRVTLIPGDGIGPELAAATRIVVDASGAQIDWEVQNAGADVVEQFGTPLPAHVVESVEEEGRAQGPHHHPGRHGLPQRQRRAAARARPLRQPPPVQVLPGRAHPFPETDLVVVRENTEDLYAGIEFEKGAADTAEHHRRDRAALEEDDPRRRGDQHQDDLGLRHPPDRQVRLRLRPARTAARRSPPSTRRTS